LRMVYHPFQTDYLRGIRPMQAIPASARRLPVNSSTFSCLLLFY
jgi:hypothetical protein